jgi:putative membrane protein
MLRLILRSVAIHIAGIYIAAQILNGVITFYGGFNTLVLAAVFISVANLVVKPLINLFLLPIHLITLGLFRWIANLIILYLLTIFIPSIKIHSFISSRIDLVYMIFPSVHVSAFGAYIISTLILTAIFHILYWLLQD